MHSQNAMPTVFSLVRPQRVRKRLLSNNLELLRITEVPRLGRYRHYKRNDAYSVIAIVRHSETEETLVLYRAEYGKKELWVRPIDDFCERVNVGDLKVRRFELIARKRSA